MNKNSRWAAMVFVAVVGMASTISIAADATRPAGAVAVKEDLSPPDLAKQPTLYVIPYAHLDTQWRWAYPETISQYVRNTLTQNFAMIDKYPDYVFNFTGSRRYRFMQEYFPKEFEQLKAYVAAGRWFPAGSSVDESDSNMPSGESLIRNVLYGNKFFREQFNGVASDEYMDPDCFGFPAAIPEILAHCGLKGFSTQKLTWNPVVPIPFPFGVWIGPDGSSVMAALNPGDYSGQVRQNPGDDPQWVGKVMETGKASGAFIGYHYYGTGDVGGAPRESSIAAMEQSLAAKSQVRVIQGPANLAFDAVTPEERAKLPTYKGELELTQHSAGSLTSEAASKRWNRKDELLADDAERSAVGAMWLGGRDYPGERLENAWYLTIGSQMHDMMAGTMLPKGSNFIWNDQVLAANQFSAVATDSSSAIISAMDTSARGDPIVVFNPTSAQREDVLEIDIPAADSQANGATVTGPDGTASAGEIVRGDDGTPRLAFLAKAPPVGYAVYGVDWSKAPSTESTELKVSDRQLENANYIVKINDDGDVSSIFDKRAGRELLSAPATLGLYYENPSQYPAWNMDWSDRQLPAKDFVGGPAEIKVVERGPVRVAVEITRHCEGSTFVQRIRLSAGDAGSRVEFSTDIDWNTRERSLRAAFPLTVSNQLATYDIQAGTIQRGDYKPNMYEYGFQQWFDLTDASKDYGVTVMSDCKFGSDKPSDNLLRLTLLHTPGVRGGYQDQATQDLGHHHILYALYGHQGDWTTAHSPLQAARLNQPMLAFTSTPHAGTLGKNFSIAGISDQDVAIQAIKKAEASDDVIVRLRQLSGETSHDVRVSFASPVIAAREVDGQEREIGPAKIDAGRLVADINGFGLKAFAIKLAPPPAQIARPKSQAIALPFDIDAVSTNDDRADGDFDGKGGTYPAEQFPAKLTADGVEFTLGPTAKGAKNAVACRGQQIALSAGNSDRLYLLAAADQDVTGATLTADAAGPITPVDTSGVGDGVTVSASVTLIPWSVQSWTGFIGAWDHRLWPNDNNNPGLDITGLLPGYIKHDEVAWYCSHHHTPTGDAYYQYSYLYIYPIDLPAGATSITLPNDPRIKIFAATCVAQGLNRVAAAAPMFDTLRDHVDRGDAQIAAVSGPGPFTDATDVAVTPGLYWQAGSYHFTTDGSDPTAGSPVYKKPITISATTTFKVASVDADGRVGQISTATIEVDDRTPPTVKWVEAIQSTGNVLVRFSEPIAPESVAAADFQIQPAAGIQSAQLRSDGRSVVLTLANKPDAASYSLTVTGITDASPAKNRIAAAQVPFKVDAPVYSLAEVSPAQRNAVIRDTPNLPVGGSDHWTLNAFVKLNSVNHDLHLIFGIGVPNDRTARDGATRYLALFPTGIHFWARNLDVDSSAELEIGKWQMVTATYDGDEVRLYLDAKLVGESVMKLSSADAAIHIAPPDAWNRRDSFDGDLRGLTIWPTALSAETLESLRENMAN